MPVGGRRRGVGGGGGVGRRESGVKAILRWKASDTRRENIQAKGAVCKAVWMQLREETAQTHLPRHSGAAILAGDIRREADE